MQTIEAILSARNLTEACRQVMLNKGAAGVDSMNVNELKLYLDKNRNELTELIRRGYGFDPDRRFVRFCLKNQTNKIYNRDDEVDHCLLLQILYRKIKCRETMHLFRRWLRVPILLDGKLVKRGTGVPQGSPLSPLLSNIMLHELDMARRNLRFVRYANDFSIYCKTKYEARKTGNRIFLYLLDKLRLPINREKSGIRRPLNFKVLGYSFVSTYRKGERSKYQLIVEEKRWNGQNGNRQHKKY